jgi:secondary thiamine-phosphate synthase enzyme
MKMYTESIPLQSSKPREAVNIHSRVKAAMEKSGLREGVCVVCSLSSDCALVLLQPESDFRREFDGWLDQLGADSQIQTGTFGVSFPVHLHSALLGQQLTIPFSEGRLDVGSGEAIFFIELNGVRPRRVVVKVLGE